MKQVPPDQAEVCEATYNQLTRVPELVCSDRVTFTGCQPLESLLLCEFGSGEGTLEWQAWVAAAAARRGMTAA